MKRLLTVLLAILAGQVLAKKYTQPKSPRVEHTINRDWTFNYYPSGKENTDISAVDFDDSKWKAIAVPHTWQTYETTKDVHPFIMSASEREDPYWWNGWGWYRKRFSVDSAMKDKKIFIEFDGVQKYCKVFLNGNYIGDHKGGYNSFYFDLTPHIKFGKENILAVEVSGRRDDKFGTIAPATAGNFNVYSGIYRDVRLVITNQAYVPYQGSYKHEGGTHITTPIVSEKEAVVAVKTYVKNESDNDLLIEVKNIIADADNKPVATLKTSKQVNKGELACFDQKSEYIHNPKLWSNVSPYVYSVYTEVYANGVLTDTYRSPLGFRYFKWDYADNTLIVNGQKIHIHGTNRHQEYPWLGDAIPKWLTEMDMNDIRYNLAHNFMRTGHYPNDPVVYDFNDRNGIITVEEVPNIKPINFDDQVQEQNLREMIRRDRNHPSIFFWSVGNETKDAADSKWAVEEDTTRYIHERKTEGYGDYVNHNATNLDMENLLRVTIRGWYNKDVRDLEPGNGTNVEKSGQQAGTEEWQHKMARVDGGSIRGRIDKNIVAWLYADHGADRIYKDSPLKNVNAKGWTDLYRMPKYMYYLWQANYLERPMIFIHPHHWRAQYLGQKKNIQVDSNCDVVELFVNGKSIGKQYPSKENFHTVEYTDVAVEKGIIKAIGTKDGKKTEYQISMAGNPAKIVLKSSHAAIPADRSGLAIITADIVDAKGVHVYGATNTLKWEVIGDGSLVGHHTYGTDINKNSDVSGCGYIDTPVSNVVRSSNKAGTITIKVSAEGLQDGTITLSTYKSAKSATGITEPELSDEGRMVTMRDTSFNEVVEYVVEMKRIVSPEQIKASDSDEYRKVMTRFVVERNPGIDKKSIEFEKLIKRLTIYIENVNGELTEDDYNFIARTFNDTRMLAKIIETKNFHPDYAKALREYYSHAMLVEGKMVDVSKESEKINQIPRELDIVVYVTPEETKINNGLEYERTKYYNRSNISDLDEIITILHPEYAKMNDQVKTKVKKYLVQINPMLIGNDGKYRIAEQSCIAIPKKMINQIKTN